MGLYQAVDGRLHDLLRTDRGNVVPRLFLVDVGVSGGINPVWRHWGDGLSATGFDMIGSEIARLSAAEKNPGISYRHARVATSDPVGVLARPPRETQSNYAVHRTSGYLATVILEDREDAAFEETWRRTVRQSNPPATAAFANLDDREADPYIAYFSSLFSRGEELDLATERTALDTAIAAAGLDRPTFLKIDVDGYEFDVLQSGRSLLESGHLLGIEVEIQFHGPAEAGAGAFADVDLLLRSHGFTLFDIETVRHGRSALPRPFAISEPAETVGGPVQWGNALYLRDIGDPAFADKWPQAGQVVGEEHLRCQVLLLDVFGLPDAAAELVLANPGLFEPAAADEAVLSKLAERVYGPEASHAQLVARFGADPKSFCATGEAADRSLASRGLAFFKRRMRNLFGTGR